MRKRGLRWLHRHGHLDDVAVHTMDSAYHAGGWSCNASVTIPGWDRHGLERLVRYCARPPLSQERLGRLNDETLVYSLRKPTVDGRTELVELLHNPAKAMTHAAGIAGPIIKTAYSTSDTQTSVLWSVGTERASSALRRSSATLATTLRKAVIETAGPSGATLQLLTEARDKMDLDQKDHRLISRRGGFGRQLLDVGPCCWRGFMSACR